MHLSDIQKYIRSRQTAAAFRTRPQLCAPKLRRARIGHVREEPRLLARSKQPWNAHVHRPRRAPSRISRSSPTEQVPALASRDGSGRGRNLRSVIQLISRSPAPIVVVSAAEADRDAVARVTICRIRIVRGVSWVVVIDWVGVAVSRVGVAVPVGIIAVIMMPVVMMVVMPIPGICRRSRENGSPGNQEQCWFEHGGLVLILTGAFART